MARRATGLAPSNGDHPGTTRPAETLTDRTPADASPPSSSWLTCANVYRYVLGVKGSSVQIRPSRQRIRSSEPVSWRSGNRLLII